MAATETQIKSIHVMTSLIIQVIVKIYPQKGKKYENKNKCFSKNKKKISFSAKWR